VDDAHNDVVPGTAPETALADFEGGAMTDETNRCKKCGERASTGIIVWKPLESRGSIGNTPYGFTTHHVFACDQHLLEVTEGVDPSGLRTVWHDA
jgi:hypothetical protein